MRSPNLNDGATRTTPVLSLLFSTLMLPYVLDETLVCQFKYWDQTIRLGMRYNEEFYTLKQFFAVDERIQAYGLALELCKEGYVACITVSQAWYGVWIRL